MFMGADQINASPIGGVPGAGRRSPVSCLAKARLCPAGLRVGRAFSSRAFVRAPHHRAVYAADSHERVGGLDGAHDQSHFINRTQSDGSRGMHASTVWQVQPETQHVKGAATIGYSNSAPVQREIPLLAPLTTAEWVDESTLAGWGSLRDAVVWCWANQRYYVGMRDKARQTLFANAACMHAPHASRCLKADSAAPMELPDRCINVLEAFTGWRGIRQWQERDASLHWAERLMRRAA